LLKINSVFRYRIIL